MPRGQMAFDDVRDAGDHRDQGVRSRSDVLVQKTLQIGKASTELGHGMHSLSDLVGNENERGLNRQRAVDLGLGKGKRLIRVVGMFGKAIREPECQAIDDDHAAGDLGRAWMQVLLERRKGQRAIGFVPLDSAAVIVVVDA